MPCSFEPNLREGLGKDGMVQRGLDFEGESERGWLNTLTLRVRMLEPSALAMIIVSSFDDTKICQKLNLDVHTLLQLTRMPAQFEINTPQCRTLQ